MNKKYNRLSAVERLTIHEMRRSGSGVSEIAKSVRRPKGTVSKELKRHAKLHGKVWLKMSGAERARFSDQQARRNAKRRGRKKKLENEELKNFVLRKLTMSHWSPEAIAARSRLEGMCTTVCAKTIYSWIKKDRTECTEFLRHRGKPYRQRICHRRGKFRQAVPKKRSIDERPIEVSKKEEIGHFEVDTIVSCRAGKGGVLALRERVTRQRQYAIVPNLKAETILPILRALLLLWPAEFIKTLTFDNGSEFSISEMIKLEAFFPLLKIFYTDPYSAWQKGSVENGNGEVRWYHPKGTDFSLLPPEVLRNNITLLNNRPMKCHDWKTSQELFDQLLLKNVA